MQIQSARLHCARQKARIRMCLLVRLPADLDGIVRGRLGNREFALRCDASVRAFDGMRMFSYRCEG